MARAAFFPSRHAENVILMARAPPAAWPPASHPWLPSCHCTGMGSGQLEDVKKCCGGATSLSEMECVFGARDGCREHIYDSGGTQTRSYRECRNTYAFYMVLYRTHTRFQCFLGFEVEHIRVLTTNLKICRMYRTH